MKSTFKINGSFMLEFLIALAIFSICLIGLATLQTKSMRMISDNKDAMANGFLLDDAISRISANRNNANNYNKSYDSSSGGSGIAATDITELHNNAAAFNRKIRLAGSDDTVTISVQSASQDDTLTYTLRLPPKKD